MNPTITQQELDACKGHTPGEWKIINHSWRDTSVYSENPRETICQLSISEGIDEEDQDRFMDGQVANAALIALAPQLLREYESQAKLLEEAVKVLKLVSLNTEYMTQTPNTVILVREFLSRVEKH